MGGESKTTQTQNQQQISAPWAPSQEALRGILGKIGGALPGTDLTGTENQALTGLTQSGAAGNPWVSQMTGLAGDLFGGGTDRTGMVQSAYGNLQSQLAPTIGGQFLDPNTNPFFSGTANSITDMVRDRVNQQYAGAGRDPAGAGNYGGILGRSVSEALSPMFANAYNTERGRQLDAMSQLYGANPAGLLAGLDQQALANRQAGIGVGGAAQSASQEGFYKMLEAEAMRRGIPVSSLAQLAGITTPIAGLGGTTNMTGTTTSATSQPWYKDLTQMMSGGGQLAGGAGMAKMAFSDRRMKENIERVSEVKPGIGLYRFRYKGDDPTEYVGVMAQEVVQTNPDAVIAAPNGMLMVDYGRLGLQLMTWDAYNGQHL